MEQVSTYDPIEGFQPRGQAWDPYRADVPELLAKSNHFAIVPIYYGSNHCFLLTLDAAEAGKSLAVYKPARGEYPLYDFPSGTLYRREVGSWLVNALLGWSLVPPTVVTQSKYGIGSLQLFIESYPEGQVEVSELQRLALLDVLLNNADRKSDHLLLAEDGKLWGIDHGLTFHVHGKLRTVLWHFADSQIMDAELLDLERLEIILRQCVDPRAKRLRELIAGSEWRALLERLARLLEAGRFPDPRYKAVPYRW
jgi:hypothetical protein